MNSFPCLFINTQPSVFIYPTCLPTNNHRWRNWASFLLSQEGTDTSCCPGASRAEVLAREAAGLHPLPSPLSLLWQHRLSICMPRSCQSLSQPDWGLDSCVESQAGARQSQAEPSTLAGAEWCVGGSWQQCPVPVSVGCACLVAMGKQLLPWALSSLLQCIETTATAPGWTYCISCKAESDLHDPVSTPGLLFLHDALDSRKTDCPTLCGPSPVHLPGVSGRQLFRWNKHAYHRAIGCQQLYRNSSEHPDIHHLFPKDTIPQSSRDSTQGCCG